MKIGKPQRDNPTELGVAELQANARQLFVDAVPAKRSFPLRVPHPLRDRSSKVKVFSTVLGALLAGGAAFAATNWLVGLNSGSSANAQGANIQNLTIADVTTGPTETNKLYPSATYTGGQETPGSGDVSFQLTNPNSYPVTVTGITVPQETLNSATANDAVGYSSNNLIAGNAIAGCAASGAATSSDVTWTDASETGTAAETFTSGSRGGETQVGAFAIAANATITVTLTDDAAMDTSSPIACAGTSSGSAPNLTYAGAYFVMPSLTTVAATAGGSSPIANGGSVTTGY